MGLKFYNSLTKSIADFSPVEPGHVRIYSCGPTPYNFVHIGNLRAFVFADLLKRYIRYRGLKVTHVMNVTDVDDKTIKNSIKEGRSLSEFTTFYTKEFIKDCETLLINPPDVMPLATGEIDSMVSLIRDLIAKGHAYKSERGDVYFRISTCPGYGEIAGLKQIELKQNADGRLSRSDEYDKESAQDFALWKAYDADDGDCFWETELGKGRPGWHIECSAMAVKYLGKPIDIHTGGIDLLFPHHTNEIAQSECGFGGEFVKLWMHNEHLIVNGKKMSKSLGNFFTLRDLLQKGYEPKAIRFELLKTHYRQQLDFREAHLTENVTIVRRFEDLIENLEQPANGGGAIGILQFLSDTERRFTEALDDDLNISLALAAIYELVTELNKNLSSMNAIEREQALQVLNGFNSVLGIISKRSEVRLPPEVLELVAQREQARKSKDFARSDALRGEIQSLGFSLLDTPNGQKITKN